MCHDEGALLREVVVEVGDDLDGHIGLSCTWRPHNLLVIDLFIRLMGKIQVTNSDSANPNITTGMYMFCNASHIFT